MPVIHTHQHSGLITDLLPIVWSHIQTEPSFDLSFTPVKFPDSIDTFIENKK